MNIPNLFTGKFVDKNGYLTPEAQHVLSDLFNELQTRMSEESHVVPSQAAADITTIATAGVKYYGGLVYDSDNDKLKVNIAGTYKEVQTV